MAATVLERLLRVFELEEKQGFRNRAVIGGVEAMSERWRADAVAQGVGEDVISAAVALMIQYHHVDEVKRPEVANAIRALIGGDLTPEEIISRDETSHSRGNQAVPSVADRTSAGQVEDKVDDVAHDSANDLDGEISIPPPEPTHVAAARVKAKRESAKTRTADELLASVETLTGVGRATAETLERLGITRIVDLLWHLPHRYDDFSQLRTIVQLEPGEQVTVVANLWDVRERKLSMKRHIVQGILADGTGTLHATWWSKYVRNQLTPGSTMRFSGKVGLYMGRKTLENPAFEELDEDMVATGRMAPVYPLTEGMSNKRLRGFIRQAIDEFVDLVDDPLPQHIRVDYDLLPLPDALRQAHFPDDDNVLKSALQRLSFDEFFYIQLGVFGRRRAIQQTNSLPLTVTPELIKKYEDALPFALTGAQRRVLGEVALDLQRSVPMTRLVQGDVGSGKTAVAAGAMYFAAANSAQSALLAPTQILAEQHYRGIANLLSQITLPDGRSISVALLTGRTQGSERAHTFAGLASGEIHVVIGTTALLEETVELANLGFVVVDEQHRFGVEQRSIFRNKGVQPHMLVMSATPIPRSLALTVYGDLDVSVIDEMPPGRQPTKTRRFRPRERERLYRFIEREVADGRQAFIVYALVEDSEKLEAGAAVQEYERLRRNVFPTLRLGLLHGRMSGQEKDEVMSAFAAGDYDVLVSTTVIEVGIDIPNASIIVIEDAERFGLAQLHQLRGRVGRGGHESYCAMISAADSDTAQARLNALETMSSGFALAEKDLELRGPGDFLGTRQSGLPALRVAHFGDMETLSAARSAAQALLETDPKLVQYPALARRVSQFWHGEGDIS